MGAFRHQSRLWVPPLELQRSTPREVTLTAQGKALVVAIIVFIVTAIVGGAALASKASADQQRWAEWKSEAVSTRGEVTGLRKRGSGDSTKYLVDYSYRVPETDYASTQQVRSGEWKRLHQGDKIDVVFRRTEPSQSWLPGHEPDGMPWYVAILWCGMFLVPAPILAFRLRQQRRLLEEGRSALAKVVGKKKVSHDRGSYYRIDYEFETIEGARRTGRFNTNRKPPEVGEGLIVVYDRDEEKRSAKYPFSLVKIATNE